MSIQSSPANKFLTELPNEAIGSIFSYLKGEKGALALQGDDRAVMATAAVCRSWRDDPALQEERRESAVRLSQRGKLQDSHRELGRLIKKYRDSRYYQTGIWGCGAGGDPLGAFMETPLRASFKDLMPSPSQLVAAKKESPTWEKIAGVVALIALGYLLSHLLGD